MGKGRHQQSSVQSVFRLVCKALAVIRSESTKLRHQRTNTDHCDALKFVNTGAICLTKILEEIERYTDLEIIAEHIYGIAGRLELHLAEPDHLNLVQNDIALLRFPRLVSKKCRFYHLLQSTEACTHLQAEIHTAYDTLEAYLPGDTVDETPTQQLAIPYDHLFYPSADRLFEAIARECQSGQEIRLRLGALQFTHPSDDDRFLDILLQCQDEQERYWSTLRLHSHPRYLQPVPDVQSPAVHATFGDVDSDDDENSWRVDEPENFKTIYSYMGQVNSIYKSYIRHVELDKECWRAHDCVMLSGSEFHAEEYTLPQLLAANLTDPARVTLGMQLAYALSYYYEGRWLSGRWQQANISFFRWGSPIPCKPWLKISLPDSVEQPIRPVGHAQPQLLELAVLLLELHLGESLNSFLGKPPAKTAGEQWLYANTAFRGKLRGGNNTILSLKYRQAIEFCLKNVKPVRDAELFREAIYEKVVLPLRSILLEQEIPLETLDLVPISRVGLPDNAPLREMAPIPPVGEVTIEIRVPRSHPKEVFATCEPEDGFELFGDEDELEIDKDRARASDDWIKKVKEIIHERIGLQPTHRVKVALLDTGIDLEHAYFDKQYPHGRIKSVCSWVDGKEGVEDAWGGDESGHGTFIASLLLDLAPNIDLYVARISKSRGFRKGTALNVANALYHSQETWDVDIITMSFGFPQGIRDIERQITRAVQREKNILVFAAASNDGRNTPRMYPARKSSVFAIHSTDSNGYTSSFNPPPLTDQNLSILGEYIESAWLTRDGSGSTRRLSGTSFATPIAVCVSAFLLAYVPMVIPDHEALFHKLQSYDGMQSLLQALVAVDQVNPASRYQYLGVAKFFCQYQQSKVQVVEALKQALNGQI